MTHNPQVQNLGDIFCALDRVLTSPSADFYDIATSVQKLISISQGKISFDKEPYFRPVHFSFFYLFGNNYLDEAGSIVGELLKQVAIKEFCQHYLKFIDEHQPLTSVQFSKIVYLDDLFSFLARLGHRQKILDLQRRETNLGESDILSTIAKQSWYSIFYQFNKACSETDYLELFIDLFTFCSTFASQLKPETFGDKTEAYLQVKMWLYRKRMIGLYAMVGYWIACKDSSQSSEIGAILENFKQSVIALYFEFVEIFWLMPQIVITRAISELRNALDKSQYRLNAMDQALAYIKSHEHNTRDMRQFWADELGLQGWSDDSIKTQLNGLLPTGGSNGASNSTEDQIKLLETLSVGLKAQYQRSIMNQNVKAGIASQVGGSPGSQLPSQIASYYTIARLKFLVASLTNTYTMQTALMVSPIKIKRVNKQETTEFYIIRRWGSSAGIFERNKSINANYGGGFYLRHNGFGLVIDPGYDFVRNLVHYSACDLRDVDGVIVTHYHLDHFADFNRIIQGVREHNQYQAPRKLFFWIPKPGDTKMFPKVIREPFCIDVSKRKGSNACFYLPNTPWGRKHGLKIRPFTVSHKQFNSKETSTWNSYGFVITPLRNGDELLSIGYSGDATYEDALITKLSTSDIVILNVSAIHTDDVVLLDKQLELRTGKKNKKNHLGYSGTLQIVEKLQKVQVVILEELYEPQSNMDYRLLLSEILKSDLQSKNGTRKLPKIFVGENGLRFRLSNPSGIHVFCRPWCNGGFVSLEKIQKQYKSELFTLSDELRPSCGNCESCRLCWGGSQQ